MLKVIFLISLVMFIGISTNYAFSQEIGLSTFQETAQIIIDEKIEHKITTSITLLSSNIQEMKIPTEIKQRIVENERIQAVVLTNENNCILGVYDQSCIIINIERNPEDEGIFAIQDNTRIIADSYIEDINKIFDTDAKFFQVIVQTDDQMNQALKTSGSISGKGIISAVYTMPMEDTDSMYTKISSMLLSKSIREGGGFYNVAKLLSMNEDAKMSFSIIALDSKLLSQLRVSVDTPTPNSDTTKGKISKINPLEFFNIENLDRSNYFSSGNYPLNSIFQIVILSNEDTNVSDVKGYIIPTQIIDDMKMPTEITKKGWIFDPEEGQQIQGKYIFGESVSINENELKFSLGGNSIQSKETELDESIIVVIIIAIVSIGAAIFYLKGYKK
ncbi:MAG: hypothetical protein NZ747_05935 [Nitrosopumilus sp.]|nr:hypothetical protein [Nitrosopumilus sp.]